MKTKILVFGVSSFLIIKLLELIDFSKYEVIGVSRKKNFSINENIRIVYGDIQNINSISDYIRQSEIIIHAAAITHSFKSKTYFDVNLEATKRMVDIAKNGILKRFVFISSNTAGKNSGTYGLTKILAEEYIKENIKRYIIFRPSEIFGGDKNEGIESLIHNSIHNSLVICPLNIPTDFFPIHMEDAVKFMFNRIFDMQSINKTIIVNGAKAYSFKQVIELARSISKNKGRNIYISRNIMFFIRNVAKLLPFSIDIIPDQIDRLYSVKEIEKGEGNIIDLEEYIKNKVDTV